MSRDLKGEMAERLTELGYEGLFMRLDTAALDELWSTPGAPHALAALTADPRASMDVRFLAAEVLFWKRPGYPPEDGRSPLAPVYAAALRAARMGNPWGLPGELDGPSGQHLVQLGETAVAVLIPLLGDSRRVPYAGSQDATFGNSYAYRVKDFAAFFVARIRNLPYTVHEDPRARDSEIDELRTALLTSPHRV